ncbi:sugar phosphate nucleotidyltransferase [Evansella cellulosilytica]|uniref:Nucleotidyl transferase n=1 Tax=Evansella cellulosilytica (strain ATCC 21833 / DSM 2522 / FERM P-1141 / JCM 9156 / N-4) TaxID=649639 RepID=E6TS86_EVAC2|nr:sugar phosphate nucleotidyltransferase [Evansella cellulosilytica]ADU31855.1 nucleotidyl transferase [Evansella cellulosilytica DSM 2522]
MNLIILAAGRGKRLGNITRDIPKPLLKINNNTTTILENNIKGARNFDFIQTISVITGYHADSIDSRIEKYNGVKTLYNPKFSDVGPLLSIWTANSLISCDDSIIINGDTVYNKNIFSEIKSKCEKEGIYLLSSTKRSYASDDVKVNIENGLVIQVSKTLDESLCDAASAGVLIIKGKNNRRDFVDELGQIIKEEHKFGKIWHELINRLNESGKKVYSINVDIDSWYEIDTVEDYENLKVGWNI